VTTTAEAWNRCTITEEEVEAWSRGLVPLPSPLTWYEYSPAKGVHSGMLVEFYADDGLLRLVTVQNRSVFVEGATYRMPRHSDEAGKLAAMAYGPQWYREETGNKCPELMQVLYLTLMLGSRSTTISSVVAPPKLNKARIKRGLCPLPDHRVVRIIPDKYIRASREEAGHSARLPPRLHWRRSHLRHLRDGRVILIPRFLVGRPELGTVSHEYRVIGSGALAA